MRASSGAVAPPRARLDRDAVAVLVVRDEALVALGRRVHVDEVGVLLLERVERVVVHADLVVAVLVRDRRVEAHLREGGQRSE